MKIKIQSIIDKMPLRPKGYYEDVISHGTFVEDGTALEISRENYFLLQKKYAPTGLNRSHRVVPRLPQTGSRIRGVGDVIHKFAQPVAKALDNAMGTHISTCGGCARRREKLNQMFPIK